MAENQDSIQPDKRTLQRQMQSGRIDERAYERYLKNLPDLTESASPVETLMDDASAYNQDDEVTEPGTIIR